MLTATVKDIAYAVEFDVVHHKPALELEGKYRHLFIKATTTCTITPITGGPGAKGETTCSVKEPFKYMRGCRLALDRAIDELPPRQVMVHLQLGSADMELVKADFHEQILPALNKQRNKELRDKKQPPNHMRRALRAAGKQRHMLSQIVNIFLEA